MGYEKPTITEVGSVSELTLGGRNNGRGNSRGGGRGNGHGGGKPNHGVS
jgi:hypothetical protein